MNKIILIIVSTLVLAGIALGIFYVNENNSSSNGGSVSNKEDTEIRNKVVQFGAELKNVSLLAPSSSLKAEMEESFGEFLTVELLQNWISNPSMALGRTTSSPWPDRIEVVEVNKLSDNKYRVEGNVIEVTSSDTPMSPAAVYPVTLTLMKVNNAWKISESIKGVYSELPKRVTIVGTWECLPHRNQSGPQTLECAIGILEDNTGKHYAVNTSLMSTYPVDYPTGSRIKIEGVLTPIEYISSETWQKYLIVGIVSATTIQEIK